MPAEQFRRDRIMLLVNFGKGIGLEVGPLDRAIALKPDCDVRYVDVMATEKLRDHYRGDPAVAVEEIPELDFTLMDDVGTVRTLAESVHPSGPYDWAIASHVIEHVPNMIGWLADIAEVMDDGGSLALVIPDRRYTFDVHRPQTTVGQLLQAHELDERMPSVRAVYDYFRTIVRAPAPDLWDGQIPTTEDRYYDLGITMDHVSRARDKGEYIDSHVWLFTPGSFVEQIVELGRIGMCDFIVERIIDTSLNELEFYACLRRVPRGLNEASADLLRASGVQHFEDTYPVRVVEDPYGTDNSTPAQTVPTAIADESATSGEPADPNVVVWALSERELRLIKAKRSIVGCLRVLLARFRPDDRGRNRIDSTQF